MWRVRLELFAEAETEWVIAQINRHVAAQPVSDKQLMDEADVNNKMALLDGMRLVERDLRKDQIAILRREVLRFFGDKVLASCSISENSREFQEQL